MWAQDKHTREWQLVPVAEASAVLEGHVTATLHDDADVTEADVRVTNAVAIGEPFATLIPSGRKNGGGSVPCDVCAADGANGSFVDENGMQYHTIQPATDTFQGICIKYRITATELRRANNTLGTNLQLSPKRLLIPRRSLNGIADVGRQKRELSKEELIASFMSSIWGTESLQGRSNQQKLSHSEARCYLELADWDLSEAIRNARADLNCQWIERERVYGIAVLHWDNERARLLQASWGEVKPKTAR
eukprot:scaffold2372_cov198-Alexandrium_tamarense.AAC.25